MTYTGDVSVGGPAGTRELPGLTITKVAVGPMDNNAYLLQCASTGELLLIDAANEAGTLQDLIGGRPLATIVTTHQHHDHWAAAERGAAGHQREHGRPSRRRWGAAGPGHRAAPARRHDQGRRRRAVRDPPARPHARQHRTALRRGRRTGRRSRTCSPATRCSPGDPATPSATRSGSPSSWMICRNGSSASCRTGPGCTRGTARTPRSAPSARTSPNGARAAGDPPQALAMTRAS